ncbi:uncharacterized protein LOC110982273 [Acanthaster planci]|uniref:Uncharacterized protein LOC110982273 n=1 Tax=Acanthaster planci TaxID=133434 RepID=A0A8B7YSK1_ACAPL|nr:uncharacterized protein LOC110982273 [Acanthaster planci]
MASKALLRRKKEEKKISKKLVVPIEQEQMEKCPVFKVHYLGKIPARGEYGREFIDESVETLLKLKDRQSKLPKTVLQITESGFHFLDVNGPFGKEKHVLIPIHHVCYGVADEQNPQVFAMITRTDSNPENSLLECHAFLCDRRKVAAQITYWLLRTFLHVFEDLQRRRRERQERKLRRQQEAALDPAASIARQTAGFQDLTPSSPTETIAPDIYSITLEGSKENGGVTAVSLTRNRPPSFGKEAKPQDNHVGSPRSSGGRKFATVPAMRFGANEDQVGGGSRWRQPVHQMHNSHESLNYHPPLKVSVSADPPITPHRIRNEDTNPSRPHSFNEGRPNMTPSNLQSEAASVKMEPLGIKGLSNPNAPLHHQQQERARYMKNPNAGRASPSKTPAKRANRPLSFTRTIPSSSGSTSLRSSATRQESDFIFIEMLQEEFSAVDAASTEHNSTIRRVPGPRSSQDRQLPLTDTVPGSDSNAAAPPLNQKLSSEDIEKRIREWLKRNSPDAENISFDDSGLDRISLAGTLAYHNSKRTASDTPRYASSTQPTHSRIDRRSVAGAFNHMPSDREYF